MLKKLILIIFSIFLMACSNVVTVKETSEKKRGYKTSNYYSSKRSHFIRR